jgi:hypothetical protein
MSPTLITGFFLCMGLFSLSSLVGEFRTGIMIDTRGNIDAKEYPGLFYLRVVIQIGFIAFSAAVVLHAFDLIGDPFVWARHYLPFLMPR